MQDIVQEIVREIAPSFNEQGVLSSSAAETAKTPTTSTASKLVRLTRDIELFHTPENEAFATVPIGTRKETLRITSRAFKRCLQKRYFEATGSALSTNALNTGIDNLEANALYAGATVPVFLRVGWDKSTVFVDLAREDGAVVAIRAKCWEVVQDPPVRFWRSQGMAPLPIPERFGDINDLRPFVNVADDTSFVLLVSWLIAALWPAGPYPILAISGEQGSAKSTISRVCRSLVDPSSVDVRLAPKDPRDLMIAAQNARIIAYDNLSGLPAWLSDALCALATGSGFGARKLRTDADEALFHATRPLLLNGIDPIATRADLADRAVLLNLPAISEEKRQAEQDFWKAFGAAKPRILGALFDGVSAVLANIKKVKLTKMPRMADFAKIATAAEPAFGWPEGTFMKAYDENRVITIDGVLDNDLVAQAVIKFMNGVPGGTWEGTASMLHLLLAQLISDSERRKKIWPKAAHVLTGRLRRAQSHLRAIGIEVIDLPRQGKHGTRSLRLLRRPLPSVSSDAPEAAQGESEQSG